MKTTTENYADEGINEEIRDLPAAEVTPSVIEPAQAVKVPETKTSEETIEEKLPTRAGAPSKIMSEQSVKASEIKTGEKAPACTVAKSL